MPLVLAQVYYETQSQAEMDPAVTAVLLGVMVAIAVFYIACLWRIFTKAGRPGWYALIPLLNTYTVIKIAGRPGWWLLLTFIPCISFVVLLIVYLDLATAFGKGTGFGLGLALLSPIFLPILAFGSASYFDEEPVRWSPVLSPSPAPAGGAMTNWGGASGLPAAPAAPRPAPTQDAPQLPPAPPGFAAPVPPVPPAPPAPMAPLEPVPPVPPVPAPVAAPAPGWYADPADPSCVRWWDGTAWSNHSQPRPPS